MNQPGAPLESRGWFRCHRSEAGMELLKANPLAFVLLYVIACRARWADGFNRHGLAKGEAFIGDFESYGMTEQNYRTAKAQLAKWKFATFKPTNKGTVAALTDTSVFSVSTMHDNGQSNDRVTDSQRTANGRVTTNLESKKERREESSKLQRAKPDAAEDAKEVDRYDESEAGIVARFKALLGKAAAANDGGKWRVRLREQRDKTLRVLQACESDHREGRRPDVSWAAYAEDTWKRFAQSHRNLNPLLTPGATIHSPPPLPPTPGRKSIYAKNYQGVTMRADCGPSMLEKPNSISLWQRAEHSKG